MSKSSFRVVAPSRATDPHSLPVAPVPAAADGASGLTEAQELARRFLPEIVSLLAATALDPASRVRPHSRMVAAIQLKSVALVGLEMLAYEGEAVAEDGPDAA
jgi:hypothetical protein